MLTGRTPNTRVTQQAIGRQFIGTSSATTAFVLAGYIIMALLGSALHISFHIRGFELEPYAWYRELRTVHYLHHLDDVNFAMVNVFIDVLFGTLKVRHALPDRFRPAT